MGLLIFLLLVLLLLKFPPGTTLEWTAGSARVVWPIGWCLAITLLLSLIMSFLRRN
jgi:hypothetical protein